MNKLIYLFIAVILVASCKPGEPHYTIRGKIAGADSITFILQKRVAGETITLDSGKVVKGEFTIKGGKVDYPEMVTLQVKGTRMGISFFLENSEINIAGHIDSLYNAKVTGSKTQREYEAFMALSEPFSKRYSELSKAYEEAEMAGDKVKVAELEKQFEEIEKEVTQARKDFVKNNPASYTSPMILSSLAYSMEAEEIESLLMAMDTNVTKTAIAAALKERVRVMKTVSIGQTAPDFSLNDIDDKPVALSSKIGKSKLLLIDFWASWCAPCRQENPNVVKVWTEFNKKGFDVFGVSLDRPGAKENWIKAIKDDKLTWTHVSDLKFWNCAAAKLYAVNAIPANFLLDDKGTIIARNLRGEDLYNKVKELLASK
jgi:peroxiredoxin